MFNEQKVEQKAGDNSTQLSAGHDITQNTYNTVLSPFNEELSTNKMKNLLRAYNEEKRNPSQEGLSSFIKQLERFSTNPDGDILDLKEKLIRGGRGLDYDDALILKEEYSKYLQSNTFSKSIQNIHAYLLANVKTLFVSYVVEEIRREGSTKLSVNDMMMKKVIIPIARLIEDADFKDEDEIYSEDIRSMIYYLTGKCHLKWE